MKELLICALEKNADKLHRWSQCCLYLPHSISGLSNNISLVIRKVEEESTAILKPKTFSEKSRQKLFI